MSIFTALGMPAQRTKLAQPLMQTQTMQARPGAVQMPGIQNPPLAASGGVKTMQAQPGAMQAPTGTLGGPTPTPPATTTQAPGAPQVATLPGATIGGQAQTGQAQPGTMAAPTNTLQSLMQTGQKTPEATTAAGTMSTTSNTMDTRAFPPDGQERPIDYGNINSVESILKLLGNGQYGGPTFETWNGPNGPVYMFDQQGPLQQLQGYQSGVLQILESMLNKDTNKDQSAHNLLSDMIGQGYKDPAAVQRAIERMQMSLGGLTGASQIAGQVANEGMFGENEQGFLDSIMGSSGGYDGITNLIQGLFKGNEMDLMANAGGKVSEGADKLASEGLFNQGEQNQYQALFDQIFGKANNASDSGGVTAGQESDFLARLNKAQGSAEGVANTGGMDAGQLDTLRGLFGQQGNRLTETAGRGAMTNDELNSSLASTRQGIMDQGRAQAESLYNGANLTGSPFAGAALVNQSNNAAGKAAGQQRAELMKYQADSRQQAERDLLNNTNARAGMESDVAGGRREGTNLLGNLAGQAGDFFLGQGGQRLQGLGQMGDLGSQFQDFLKTDAGGRVTGLEQQGNYADYLKEVLGEHAGGRKQGLDALQDYGSWYKDLFQTDTQGKLEGVDRMYDGSDKFLEGINQINELDTGMMPGFLQDLFNYSSNRTMTSQGTTTSGGKTNDMDLARILQMLSGGA